MSKELTKATTTIVEQAHLVDITTKDGAAAATEFLSRANQLLDQLLEQEETVTAPLNAALKAARAPLAAPKKALKEAIQILRTKLSLYQTEETRRSALTAKKAALDLARGKISLETAVEALQDAPEDRLETASGTLTFQDKEVLKITALHLIPRLYLVPDEKALLLALKAGLKVKGASIEIIKVPYNRRA